MLERARRQLTASNVVAIVAVFVAIGGSAVALPGKGKVDRNDIAKNAVKSKQVKADSLKGGDIDESTLTLPGGAQGPASGPAGGDLAGSYPDPAIREAAVDGSKVADESLGASELADDSVGAGEIGANAVGEGEIGANAIAEGEIAPNAVGGSEISDGAVDQGEIEDGGVGAAELANLTTVSTNLVVANNVESFATATCPAGTQAISGGADRSGGGPARISESGLTGNGWFVSVHNQSGGPVTYSVEANCLVP